MTDFERFTTLSPPDYANFLGRNQIMDFGIKELWSNTPRIAGPAFTVQLTPGDNLMLHAAIHEAPKGSVLVVDVQGDTNFAVAGGNVCMTAQRNGIAALVIDGVIRDVGEIRAARFPVFARGAIPIPGKKNVISPLNQPISCGGVQLQPDDLIVADEEGIVVVPKAMIEETFDKAKQRANQEAQMTLEAWATAHQAKIEAIIAAKQG